MTATSVAFQLSNGTPVTPEVFATFFDKPITVVDTAAAGGKGFAPAVVGGVLDATAIGDMLKVKKGAWTLLVLKDSAPAVLDGRQLKQAWEQGSGPITVTLRSPTPGEQLIWNDAGALYGPSASWDRVKNAVGYPVAQAGLIATAAGLFGLLALKDDITHKWAMEAATIVAVLASALSVFYGAWVTETEEKPARLDLLRDRQKNMFEHAIKRARVGLGLLLAAVALAVIAVWPAGEGKSPAAVVGDPTVSPASGAMKRVSVTVTWSGLDATISRVSSNITGLATPTVTEKPSSSATIEQPLVTTVPASAATVQVDTRVLDAHGKQVDLGYTKSLTLPSGG